MKPNPIETLHYRSVLAVSRPVGDGVVPVRPGVPLDQGQPSAFDHAIERLLKPPPSPDETVESLGDGASALHFSRHAAARLNSRGIDLKPEDLEALAEAMDTLAKREAKESLVLLGENAFVVGVPKRTVITAMTRKEAMGTVFTNIDSALIL